MLPTVLILNVVPVSEVDMYSVYKVLKALSLILQSLQANVVKMPILTVKKLPVHLGAVLQATVAQIML